MAKTEANKREKSYTYERNFPITRWYLQNLNRIGGVMVSVLASSEVDREIERTKKKKKSKQKQKHKKNKHKQKQNKTK
jgi:predicted histidine transporter YuiF (NhaC family)